MTIETSRFAYTDGDVATNTSANASLNELVAERYSRRQTLFGGLGATALALFGTTMLTACGEDDDHGQPGGPGLHRRRQEPRRRGDRAGRLYRFRALPAGRSARRRRSATVVITKNDGGVIAL